MSTVHEVIATFQSFNSKVTESIAPIKDAYDTQKAKKLRDTQSPRVEVRQPASKWFEDYKILTNDAKRTELIDVVYQSFKESADLKLHDRIDRGESRMTKEMRNALKGIAATDYCVDDGLAEKFVQQFMDDWGFEDGGMLENPMPVEELAATVGSNGVSINWRLPSSGCDQVIVKRSEVKADGKPGSEKGVLPKGRHNQFVDKNVKPGSAYRYSVYTLFKGEISDDAPSIEVAIPNAALVSNLSASVLNNSIVVSWKTPATGCDEVAVYRREDHSSAKAASKKKIGGGNREEISDDSIKPGKQYIYSVHSVTLGAESDESQDVKVSSPPIALPSGLVARAASGGISLNWKNPPGGFSEVILLRSEMNSASTSGAETECCRGILEQFLDASVKPGTKYEYKLRSTFLGQESKQSVSITITAVESLDQLQALWDGQVVEISQWGAAADKVHIYRSDFGTPKVHKSGNAFEPSNSFTKKVFEGPASANWRDTAAHEGVTYHYLVVAQYSETDFSEPATVSISVPKPPPPPKEARAESKNGAIAVTWVKPDTDRAVNYQVVRATGKTAPARPEDGQIISQTKTLRFVDKNIEAGTEYSYTVFSCHEDMVSRSGATTEPAVLIAEVRDLKVESGDTTVSLSWTAPENVYRVEVHRQAASGRPDEAVPLAVIDNARAQDVGLENGTTYTYLVRCVFALPGRGESTSTGIIQNALPVNRPDPVTGLSLSMDGLAVRGIWPQVARGQVVIVRSGRPSPFAAGLFISTTEMAAQGDVISDVRESSFIDPNPDPLAPFYSSFTVSGAQVVVGPTSKLIAVPDADKLSAKVQSGVVHLSWLWPDHCTGVLLTRRQDAWPEGPDDGRAVSFHVSKDDYQKRGMKFIDTDISMGGEYFYRLFAKSGVTDELAFSQGENDGSRYRISAAKLRKLTYWVDVRKKFLRNTELILSWEMDEKEAPIPGFVLIASPGKPPSEPNDGQVMFRLDKDEAQRLSGEHVKTIDTGGAQGALYFKLFLADAGDPVMLIHPDVTTPIEIK